MGGAAPSPPAPSDPSQPDHPLSGAAAGQSQTADQMTDMLAVESTAGEYVPVSDPVPSTARSARGDAAVAATEAPEPVLGHPEALSTDSPASGSAAPDSAAPDSAAGSPAAPDRAAPDSAADSAAGRPDPDVQRGSGDAAVAAAQQRSAITAALNVGETPPLPIPGDTANLRLGPALHPDCRVLLPLVGVWQGTGEWSYPSLPGPRQYGQQITISHDGRPFLRHEAIAWLIDPDGDEADGAAPAGSAQPAAREVGWWRPQPDGTIELLIAHAEGVVELFYGQARTVTSWSFGTDAVVRTASAAAITGATRLYGIVDGKLAYVEERATADHELQPHTSALLERMAG